MNNDPQFLTVFNQQRYFFKITIYNGDKNTAPLELDYFFVDQLAIEETIFNWYASGFLILKNEYEFFERGAVNGTAVDKFLSIYTFRNDGRNKVNIRIFPIFSPDLETAESISPELWEINYDFVVYNVEDLPAKDLAQKRKKLFLWDERYQHFLERNIQWSTYYVAAKKQLANNPKLDLTQPLLDTTCKVGEAIKHLLQTACGETDISLSGSTPLKVGWDPKDSLGNIKAPNLRVASFSDSTWDDGAELNKINYTSPAGYSVINDLDYLMQYYVSSRDSTDAKSLGTQGLLFLDRYTKKWSLVGIDHLFKDSTAGDNAGINLIEKLYVQMPSENISNNSVKKLPESPAVNITGSANFVNISAGVSSNIYAYRFTTMAGVDDLKITNKPAVNYDNAASLWKMYYKDNSIENISSTLKQEFLPKLYGKKLGALIGVNKSKLNGINTYPTNVVMQGDFVKVLNRNEAIYSNILLNQALEFDALGLTIRTPGKFIAIDRLDGNSANKNDFEDRFIGQWMLARVVHNFAGNKYLTNTVSVKMHSFNELAAFKPENDSYNE